MNRTQVACLVAAIALAAVPALSQTPAGATRAGLGRPFPHGPAPLPELQLPRGTLDIRMEPRQGATPSASWRPTQAPVYVPIPRMSANFVAAEDDTQLAITFSAEAMTSASSKRMFVRALVDGVVADPADIVFTEGNFGGARSFTFTDEVDAGIHTVEMQWLVDPGASASLRAASLMLRHGMAEGSGGTVTHKTPPSGEDPRTSDSFWTPVPDMTMSFYLPANAEPIVSFSAETFVTGLNKRMFVRALIDGAPLSPGDVVFAQRSSRQAHQMRFTGPTMAAGWHTASIEWLVDNGGGAIVGDRTLCVTAFPQSSQLRHDLVVAPSGPAVSTSSSSWAQVPNLSALVPLPDNAELAVSFSGEVMAAPGAELEMRLVANGVAIDQESVFVASFGQPFETQSFSFDRKHIFLGPNTLTGVWLEWRAAGGTVWMGDRAMELVAEGGLVPDVAEAPQIGLGTSEFPQGAPVEAAIGTRKVLTIIHRIPRAAPNHVIPTVAQVTSAMFGPTGVADWYKKVSGGRFQLENAGVLEYDSLKSEAHYWNHGAFDCGQAMQDGFAGGHTERWAESISLANPAIDFASFDKDQNGTVDPNELAILIIAPQGSTAGFTRALDPYCNGASFTVDGVEIPSISEWFTSNPSANWEVAGHELAHLILGLGDAYANGWNFDTEAGRLSMMGDNLGTTSHFDGPTKLALGWATPVYTNGDGTYELQDVKESERVAVLPRDEDGDGQEYFVLETRRSEIGNPLYDTGTGINGVILWHVVESAAQHANPPACTSVADWANVTGNLRRAVRALRPGVDFASGGPSSWDAGDYDLLDSGLNCPGGGPVRNALLWADGGASGWHVTSWSAAGPLMSFYVEQ